jgi:hypothetical protein
MVVPPQTRSSMSMTTFPFTPTSSTMELPIHPHTLALPTSIPALKLVGAMRRLTLAMIAFRVLMLEWILLITVRYRVVRRDARFVGYAWWLVEKSHPQHSPYAHTLLLFIAHHTVMNYNDPVCRILYGSFTAGQIERMVAQYDTYRTVAPNKHCVERRKRCQQGKAQCCIGLTCIGNKNQKFGRCHKCRMPGGVCSRNTDCCLGLSCGTKGKCQVPSH